MRKLTLTLLLSSLLYFAKGQTVNPRPLTMDEYKKAQSFTIANLDNDTYIKFENTYVLDRYESRKPYFITGSDGLKKRIDLYKLVAKEGMQEIGLMVFYTNEKGKLYKALVPDFTADAKVWEQYFLDIDNINKVEQNFILKLSYVLSKEVSFQQYKVLNGGKDLKEEAATYGNDICFPGEELVTMANGDKKMLKAVKSGDEVISVDPATKKNMVVKVKELTTHEAKNYAITQLVLISAQTKNTTGGKEVKLNSKVLQATPNHPMLTKRGNIKIGEVTTGQEVLCLNEQTGKYEAFTVLQKTEHAGGVQKVYNIVADGGSTLLMNGVMVMQK
ncbi:intein N-terminal splicing region [Mucilaginibacter gossypiicola]|uniref:Intein N-terminal splicing region n=1 Tax=Mucilaginibacter gossypiicola TaxID=551995 RepID=A0A1H8KAA3_9SPHI|nr:Hint domain-containing protein [Mucilaginibacter gossypiicola]SEN89844.1 intein N-terminal splicing region [Mucilaginibacter gossypiicola]